MKKDQASKIANLITKLNQIPDEEDVSFPYKIRDVIIESRDFIYCYPLIYSDNNQDLKLRFKAFYSHVVELRQKKELQHYRDIIDRYNSVFYEFKLFNALLGQYYQSKKKNKNNLSLAVEYSEKAIIQLPSSPNVLHLFAELVADLHDYSEEINRELLQKAEREIEKAIAINEGRYAKYYATKARILAFQMKFREAKDAIQLAIELEPSASIDYSIRIGDYQGIKTNISYIEYTLKMQNTQADALKSFDEVRNKVIELLGLLSAIIAFVITSVQISKDMPFSNAAKLMVIMGGVCTTVFSTFSFTFFRNDIKVNQVIALLLGLTLIGLGFVI